MKNNSLTIIIVTYNGTEWLDQCLKNCAGMPVVIIDNASTDDTVSFIETNYPKVTLLKQSVNLGFGQANNLGITYALDQGAEQVFLLNQDAYLQNNCIETLIAVQKNNPSYGILSAIHLNGQGNRLDQNFSNYVSYKNNPHFYSDFILNKSLDEVYEVPFVNAAGWLLSRSILEKVGGFDPMFFHYGEDDNYCQRAIYHGFKIGVVPNAFLLHDREDRFVPPSEKYSNQYFSRRARTLKLQYGNINLENLSQLDHQKRRLIKNILKAKLKWNWTQASNLKQELDLVTKLLPEITKSRNQNKISGKTYL